MSGFDVATILDKKDRTLPKPFNIHPGFDMKCVNSYIQNYFGINDHQRFFDTLFDNERLFDTLSTIKQNKTPVQWGIRVRVPLQNLLNAGKFSVYHRYALFESFGQGKLINFDYRRPRIHKSHMAIYRTLPKPFNIHPGFDMKYVNSYIQNYFGINDHQRFFDTLFDNERLFDTLSTIKQNKTPVQWGIRVRVPLQNLLNAGKFSVYHRYALFESFGQGKLINFDYRRPRIHKSHMAICFGCWKLIKIDDVHPKKSFHFTRQRYVDRLVPNNECDKPKTDFGRARVIQRAYKRFKERVPSNARLAWNSLPNDGTPDDEKLLGLTRRKVKNPQIREQFNQWRTKWMELYKNNPMMRSSIINRQYKEYYIPDNWIDSKKSQLRERFRKRLLEIKT
ncbi:hypothetical protein Glove_661g57 [Diversispora epigaea]|uniref:Uncharacterized protein n=1 Tax=Diversispora epigaea TaxID=1348612 RepID=A0A397G7V0_9GLOM|nr:hypothetical protein Glove_661g57 [Diversispora epigaea]